MSNKIKYSYDGHDFFEMGVVVKASAGVIDLPEAKDRAKYEWSNMNGHIIDQQQRPQYKPREIELQCQMYAHSAADYISKLQAFSAIFRHEGLRLLEITLPGVDKPLVYLCYLTGGIEAAKTWSASSMVGTFTLTLEEPEPLKRVLQNTAKNVSLTLDMGRNDVINVYWGDGQSTLDIATLQDGDILTAAHTYTDNTPHTIIITGDVEYVNIEPQNATEIWNLL